MSKFLFIYRAPETPADAPEPSPEQMQAVMAEWTAWGERVGAGLVDFGAPLADGVRVTGDAASSSTRDVRGYSIVEASDLDGALELVTGHPHLSMPGGEVEVHTLVPLPGM